MPGTWTQTASGLKLDVLEPSADAMNIEDVAISLSKKCRYNGHTKDDDFYSVAEHTCLGRDWLLARGYDCVVRLYFMVHDAPEAYSPFGDVPRPLKENLVPQVRDYESKIELLFYRAIGLPPPPAWVEEIVDSVDKNIVADECRGVMATPPEPWDRKDPLGVQTQAWDNATARREFMRRYREDRAEYDALMIKRGDVWT